MILSNAEYNALLGLYHDYQQAFLYLPANIKEAFFTRLHQDRREAFGSLGYK